MGSPLRRRAPASRQVRRAGPGDAAALSGIEVRSWRAAYRDRFPEGFVDALPEPSRQDWWEEALSREDAVTLVATDHRGLVGFCRFLTAGDPQTIGVGEVLSLYVDPSAWGRGHGRVLLDRALADLRSTGLGEAVLWVLAGNERAIRFYEAAGWWPDGSWRPAPWFGPAAREVRYRRSL